MAISTIRIDAKLKRMATRYKKMQHRFKALERKRLTSISKVREAKLKKRKVKLGTRMDKLVRRMKALVAKKNSVRHLQLKDPKRRKRKAVSSKRKATPKAAAKKTAKASSKTVSVPKLTTTQIDAGAKFFTCRDLGIIEEDETVSTAKDLKMLWRKCQAENSDTRGEFYQEWVDILGEGDKHWVGELQKTLPWLFH